MTEPTDPTRRRWLQVAAGATGAMTALRDAHAADTPGSHADAYASATDLAARLADGRLTATALTRGCLERIEAIDRQGPALRSVIELNPDALEIAAALDAERAAGKPRGPLHGLPVLLKDNIATADRMQTTAGTLALVGAKAPRDAQLVTRLRAAGAVILGKTNLSEWANIRSTRSISGWSSRGGLTRNPHALDRNTSGSSSGSASAVAAGLAPLTVGTETDGSIVSPSSICGVVGFKPTVGLASRDGIVPISHTQDTPGPMTRSVADAQLLMRAMAGADPRDAATRSPAAQRAAEALARPLDANALRGARLGVVRSALTGGAADAVFERALDALRAQGAVLVDPVTLRSAAGWDDEMAVLLYELKANLNAYLAEFGSGAPIRSLADAIAHNRAHPDETMAWFGQELFERAQKLGDLKSPAYLKALANCRRDSRLGLHATLRQHRLDALVAPTGGTAWLSDPVNGDHYGGSFSTPAAVAGTPHLTVPAGFVQGLPLGLSFAGAAWSDARILALGHAYEQATRAWRAPQFLPTAALSPPLR